MSTGTLASPEPLLAAGLRATIAPLALGLILLGLLFHAEVSAAVRVWTESTAYNHCFLVIPIVAYLIWDRRWVLSDFSPQPWIAPSLFALPIGAIWLLADRIGIMEGRQLAAMCLVELFLLVMLGRRLYFALLGPLLYLFFLVPFGAFVTPSLQDFTADFTIRGLNLLGIPNYSDGFTIEIPEGTFFIAEACAGLRFLIAAVAFGCLYALLMYRSPLRRAIFILVSIIVPIIANGLRALGIVTLGHLLGSAQAAATDHVLYGWIFFSIVILLLVALGLPFREDDHPPARTIPDTIIPAQQPRYRAMAAVLGLSAVTPLIGLGLDQAAAAALPARAPDLSAGGCTLARDVATIGVTGPGRIQQQLLLCGGYGVRVVTEVLSSRMDPGVIFTEQRRFSAIGRGDVVSSGTLTGHNISMRLVQTDEPKRSSASTIWLDGKPVTPSLAFRIRQGLASIVGGHGYPVVISVLPDPDPTDSDHGYEKARQAISAYLSGQPNLGRDLSKLSTYGTTE